MNYYRAVTVADFYHRGGNAVCIYIYQILITDKGHSTELVLSHNQKTHLKRI